MASPKLTMRNPRANPDRGPAPESSKTRTQSADSTGSARVTTCGFVSHAAAPLGDVEVLDVGPFVTACSPKPAF